jgi:hypothetical protein
MEIGKDKLEELLSLDERPATFELIEKATGEPYKAADGSPVTLTVVGEDSKRVRAADDAVTRRMLGSRRSKATPEDLLNNRIARASAAVIAWHGIEDEGGAPLPCTQDLVRGLLVVPDHLRQVEEAVGGHSGFFVKRSGS